MNGADESRPTPARDRRSLSQEFLTDLFRHPLDAGYADAAARRSAPEQAPRWRYGTRALTLLVLVAVGMLFTVAYRQVVAAEPARAQVRAELVDQINQREAETAVLRSRADELRSEVSRLRDEALADPQARQLRELEARTGLAPVRGDGVVVRVDDGPPGVDPDTGAPVTDPDARILDADLQRIANGLWAAGAEAVAINDQRLTATSTIRGASGAILVDRQPVPPPYEVLAIGPDDLEQQFAESTGPVMELLASKFGIAYDLHVESDLTLPAAVAPKLRHAEPVDTAPPGGD